MRRILYLLLALVVFAPLGVNILDASAQTPTDPEVEALLAQMGPEERVGQLFLVTFYGSDVSSDSDIAELITQYRIGGVVLQASNDNFPSQDGLPSQVYQLTAALQSLATSEPPATEETFAEAVNGPYIPLFIGLEHEGSSGTHNQLHSGVTPLASNMALGATWDPALSQTTGEVAGRELAALGINLLLGPAADVVENPQPFTPTGDLGTREFGGDPYWVAQMTAAYVTGVHVGSNGRIAVFPKYFPGHGGADRQAVVEVPTIRRSLDQLTQVDLKPFFAVTGNASDPLAQADGLMSGHISYLGFQGDNPRRRTQPISLDQQALSLLMRQPPIEAWRAEGGLMVSDSLGLRGVRRYYDAEETVFYNRRIAQDALLAGNDLLYLGTFGENPASETQTITDTIEFFVQQYNEDPAFKSRVDDAVRRILRKKLELYGELELSNIVPPPSGLAQIGQQPDITVTVAQNALTLLFPDNPALLASPLTGEHIVIFTDTRSVRQCSICEGQALIPVDALQSSILRQYGPQATGVVGLANIQSFSFEALVDYQNFQPVLDPNLTPQPDDLGIALQAADWIVFVMLDVNSNVPASNAVRQFLAEPPVSSETQIVVMAMGAPYYLDSTEVSKLSAYYGVYGYSRPFVDVAARALFQGAAPRGASPVSVSAVNYNILTATSPEPSQVISLSYEVIGSAPTAGQTPAAVNPQKGDTLTIRTGMILDRNGHSVPDGTPVEFIFDFEGFRDTETVETVNGVAQTQVSLSTPGELRISAQSPPALNSRGLRLVITDEAVVVESLEPDPPLTTATPTATETNEAGVETEIAVLPTPTIVDPPPDHPNVNFGDLYLALFGLVGIGGAIFVYGMNGRGFNDGLLLSMPAILFGLLAYNYYALMLPGTGIWLDLVSERWAAASAAWVGALIGVGVTYLALRSRNQIDRFLRH